MKHFEHAPPALHNTTLDMEGAILRSRKRSAQYGVDPTLDGAPESNRLNKEQLQFRIEQQHDFFVLAKAQLDSLYRLLQNTGFCMALSDKDGYVLYVIGDAELVEHFKRRRCLPGYRWTEKDIGTCAIGLALAERTPVFLPGDRMYSSLAREISNAGAPVFNPAGELIGAISLSGKSHLMHVHTLGLVRQAAETVTSQLREQEQTRELAIKHQYMLALLESDSQGMLTVDQEGCIVQANQKALSLLQLPQQYEGTPFEDLIGKKINIRKHVQAGEGFQAREITNKKTGVTHYASLDPIRLQHGELVGGLFSLTEKKEMMRMAVTVTGPHAHFTFDSIIGSSPAMHDTLYRARIAADNNAPVLLLGETGTGKELFAQAIHNASSRSSSPFVAINCGAIPKELIESELFGYEEGAFTGAQKGGRPGKIELADTGTLFLDEIGDMPIDMQVKLLRVLQSGELQRVGGLGTVRVDVRVISATNKDLSRSILKHQFRSDLFYRIKTLTLAIPPLRDRPEDILELAKHFIQRHELQLNRRAHPLPQETIEVLQRYSWPGNVRQLEGAIECAMHMAEGGLLLPELLGLEHSFDEKLLNANSAELHETFRLDVLEKHAITAAYTSTGGNIRQTALALGVSRPTLYRKLKKYGIAEEE